MDSRATQFDYDNSGNRLLSMLNFIASSSSQTLNVHHEAVLSETGAVVRVTTASQAAMHRLQRLPSCNPSIAEAPLNTRRAHSSV
jgi:hypothetical protein